MDDSCAVCAESLEWVAYGACGHREVCSTCVVRLRFICDDKRCCICKTESPVIFVTKALGDYTRMINDFTVLPSEPREGRLGSYWYHEDSQAYFDDADHYKMIKAMCRLSCSVCDKMEEANDGPKRRAKFKNIDQLKGHLFHRHRLLMCSLCLEGRKVFICEQKLYTRAQLNQHVSTGNSEVDGSESERGGFMGHPMCEFCKSPFYGDNELYTHMSTEHYTCHICQRQHPGQYEYYKNYDDLEIHFRREHFLCEDEACLAKKFVVFQNEAEMKRHNAIEHGGRMSRAKRNAALQIPTSFQFRRRSEQEHFRGSGRGRGRGRGRGIAFHHDQYDDQLSIAIQASMETADSEGTSHDPPPPPSNASVVSNHGDADDIDPLIQPFESLATTDSVPSRYLHALGQGYRSTPLENSSFPPLLMNTGTSQQQNKQEKESSTANTMAAHLQRQKRNIKTPGPAQAASSSAEAWPAPFRGNSSGISVQSRPNINPAPLTLRSSGGGPALSGYATSVQAQARPASNRIMHSASAPNLSESRSAVPSVSDFPPVSVAQVRKTPQINSVVPNVEHVQTANKSLVEKIRAAVDYDEDKYSSFKDISSQYRQGSISTDIYLHRAQEYGLLHLVPELASLCPDPQKQKELVDSYNAIVRSDGYEVDGGNHRKNNVNSKKGKAKVDQSGSSKDKFSDSVLSTVRTLQAQYKAPQEEAEVLTKDGYRGTKGKVQAEQVESSRTVNVSTTSGNGRDGGSGNKQRKKSSKFHRMRLGDGSMAAIDSRNSDPDPDPVPAGNLSDGGLPVRGVWKKGGHKLFL